MIKFQLGVVDPTWSVSYRFLLAGIALLVYVRIKGLNMQFNRRAHVFMILQGILLFGVNYWLVYIAEEQLISALVAVSFSTIIFLNIIFGSIFLKRKSEGKVYVGAVMGILGTYLLFRNDLLGLKLDELPIFHLIMCFLSVVVASLGNITSAYNQSRNLPVVQTNAYGMLYGGLFIGLIAFFSGAPLSFDFSTGYVASLVYLSAFGSIIAFGSYLTLIGKIGADKAAYALVVIPVIAVVLSILFEDFRMSWQVFVGILFILGGNIIILERKAKSED
ncbi:MAG: EamA family transporter [Ekhidna sp.]